MNVILDYYQSTVGGGGRGGVCDVMLNHRPTLTLTLTLSLTCALSTMIRSPAGGYFSSNSCTRPKRVYCVLVLSE